MKEKTAAQVFNFFQGCWKIERDVVSRVSSECHTASGYGIFVVSKDDPTIILYSEKVTIHHLGVTGTQKYKYKYDVGTSAVSKYFYDGRLFYTLNLDHEYRSEGARGEHLCIQDEYKSYYVFGVSEFMLTYSVNGPFKCYDITTEYIKISDEDACTLGITIENGKII